jgi:hypothetical protein
MIQPNELMLGNWVRYGSNILKVVGIKLYPVGGAAEITTQHHINGNSDYYDPIPITPEILEKAGFEKYLDESNWLLGEDFCLHYYMATGGYCFKYKDYKSITIQYLHQLQNLYYVLKGTELNINLSDKEAPQKQIKASDLYTTKIRVTPEESVLVQKKAFELGYRWIVEGQKVSFVNAYYLLFSDNKLILYMKWDEGIDFMAHDFKEITLKDILG